MAQPEVKLSGSTVTSDQEEPPGNDHEGYDSSESAAPVDAWVGVDPAELTDPSVQVEHEPDDQASPRTDQVELVLVQVELGSTVLTRTSVKDEDSRQWDDHDTSTTVSTSTSSPERSDKRGEMMMMMYPSGAYEGCL